MKYLIVLLALCSGCAVSPVVEKEEPPFLLPLSGVILDAETGKPISGAEIYLFRKKPQTEDFPKNFSYKMVGRTGEEGIYNVRPVDINCKRFVILVGAIDYRTIYLHVDNQGRVLSQYGGKIPYDKIPAELVFSLEPRKIDIDILADMYIENLTALYDGKPDISYVDREIEEYRDIVANPGQMAGRIHGYHKKILQKLEALRAWLITLERREKLQKAQDAQDK